MKCAKCFLISKEYTADSIGQQIPTETFVSVFCSVSNVSASEFMSAGQLGIKPDFRVTIWAHEYNGQDEIELNNKRYSVYRTFQNQDGRVELYVQKKVSNNEQSNQAD